MIKPTFKNHVKEFDDYLMALKKQMGPFVTWEKLIKNEAAAILASAAKKTKKGKAGLIRKKYTIKQRGKKNMPEGAKQKKDKKGKFKKTGRTKGSKTPQNDELIPFVKMNGRDKLQCGKPSVRRGDLMPVMRWKMASPSKRCSNIPSRFSMALTVRLTKMPVAVGH